MKFGNLELFVISDGTWYLDGGQFFGIVPRVLWEKKFPVDASNRVRLGINCLLIHTGDTWILVETGAGDRWTDKQREIYGFARSGRLPEILARLGLQPEDIHVVVNTHLHFDHSGWNVRTDSAGKLAPMFPHARYFTHRNELSHARQPSERERGSYMSDSFEAVVAAGQFQLLEGDREIAPGVELIRTPGHVADLFAVRITSGGKTAFFFSDNVPSAAHLSYPWIMSFDLYPLKTLEQKQKWISEAVKGGWLCFFVHDPNIPAAYLREKEGRVEALAVPEAWAMK